MLHVVKSFVVFVTALKRAKHFSIINRNAFTDRIDFTDENSSILCSTDQQGIIVSDSQLSNSRWMKLNLSKIFAKFHRIGKGPLVCSNLSKRSSHKYGSNFIYDKEFSYIVWVSPHYSELLGASITIEFSNTIRIAKCHDIENTIESRADAFTVFIPNLK